MAILSPLRARRFANRPVEKTQQVVVFCLEQSWFALPLAAIQRVAVLDHQAAEIDPSAAAAPEETFFDMVRCLFVPAHDTPDQGNVPSFLPATERCLIVLQTDSGNLVHFVLNAQPQIQRIQQNRIEPLTAMDRLYSSLRCVPAVISAPESETPLYLIDPHQLGQAAKTLCQA